MCDSGYLLYNDQCVPSQQCGCWHNGQHYPVGSEFWTDNTCSSKCTCPARGSKVQCFNASCPAGQFCGVQDGRPECLEQSYGICHVHGDPHYNTFDKVTHNFMGNCTYTLAKVCSNTTSLPYFNVEAKNEHRGNTRVSYVREVLVEVYGERIAIVKKEKSQVLVGSGAGMSMAQLQGSKAGLAFLGRAWHDECQTPSLSQVWVGSPEATGLLSFSFLEGLRRKRQMGNVADGEERPLQGAEQSHGSASQRGNWVVRASRALVCCSRAGSGFPWGRRPRDARDKSRAQAHGGVSALGEQCAPDFAGECSGRCHHGEQEWPVHCPGDRLRPQSVLRH